MRRRARKREFRIIVTADRGEYRLEERLSYAEGSATPPTDSHLLSSSFPNRPEYSSAVGVLRMRPLKPYQPQPSPCCLTKYGPCTGQWQGSGRRFGASQCRWAFGAQSTCRRRGMTIAPKPSFCLQARNTTEALLSAQINCCGRKHLNHSTFPRLPRLPKTGHSSFRAW